MIDFILFISGIYVLGLLYFQWKINWQQEQFIKTETEALKKLQEINQKYIAPDVFGLLPDCPYLTNNVSPTPEIVKQRPQLLIKRFPKATRSRHLLEM